MLQLDNEALGDISALSLPLPLVQPFEFDEPPSKEIVQFKRRQWTLREDKLLLNAISAVNILAEFERALGQSSRSSWPRIAELVPGRLPRQCWDRFANHVNPTIDHSSLRRDEIDTVVRLHQVHGNKWTKISDSLTHRTPMQVKNFVHSKSFAAFARRNTMAPSERNQKATAVNVVPARQTPGITFKSVKRGAPGSKYRDLNRKLGAQKRGDFCVDVRSVTDNKGVLRATKFKKITKYLKHPAERGAAKRRTAAALLQHKVSSELRSLTPFPCVTDFF